MSLIAVISVSLEVESAWALVTAAQKAVAKMQEEK